MNKKQVQIVTFILGLATIFVIAWLFQYYKVHETVGIWVYLILFFIVLFGMGLIIRLINKRAS